VQVLPLVALHRRSGQEGGDQLAALCVSFRIAGISRELVCFARRCVQRTSGTPGDPQACLRLKRCRIPGLSRTACMSTLRYVSKRRNMTRLVRRTPRDNLGG
jgi:hypothetical protein